jgi:hypothetical protein
MILKQARSKFAGGILGGEGRGKVSKELLMPAPEKLATTVLTRIQRPLPAFCNLMQTGDNAFYVLGRTVFTAQIANMVIDRLDFIFTVAHIHVTIQLCQFRPEKAHLNL